PSWEKNTIQATISQLFQRKAAKNANLTKQQSKPTSPPTTPIIPPVITTTTTQMQYPFLQKVEEKVSTNSDSDDDETHVTGSMVESSRIKKVKKFDFVTKDGKRIHLTKEQINQQKKVEEEAKAEAAKRESEVKREELVYLLGPEQGTSTTMKSYSMIDIMTKCLIEEQNQESPTMISGKGWTTIYDWLRTRMDYIHTTEVRLGINLDIPLSEHDPLDKLNDLANKKRKHANYIHDYVKANKRFKSSVQYEDHLVGTVLNEHVLGGNLLSKTTREALNIIENKSKVCYSRNKPNVSRMNSTSRKNDNKTDDRIDKLADQISTLVDVFAKKVVTPATVKAVEESCVTYAGNHAYYNCDATNNNQSSVCDVTGTYNQVVPPNSASNYMAPFGFAPVQNNSQNRFNQNQGQGNNFNRRNNFHGFSNEFSSYKKANDQMMRNMQNQINSLKREFKNEIQNTMKTQQTILMEQQNGFQTNLQNMLSGFFQNQASTSGTLPSNTIPNPKGEMKAITTRSGVAYEGPSITTKPSPKKVVERETEETTDKEQTNFQGSTAHIQPQDKLFELAKIRFNENCSAMLLKKLLENLGDHGKFLISCDFPGMGVCHALADLANRSITYPKGVAEDVFVKVGKFHFLIDFVVVDFEADPRVPLILGRSFLRTGRTLIDVYGEEITLWVNGKAVTFNLNQTTRYSSTYDDMSVNRIDIIDVAREEYAQEILGFSNNSLGGNPTSTFEPIISDSSPSLTSFEGSDFILEEIEAYLMDESISPESDHVDCDSEGYICLIEKLLKNDPFQLLSIDLKQGEVVKAKSSIEEPP
nr:reverse transcriptase domain-containing protein [Tanacetum cinerariifolium]